jgi:serine/threonine protein kinase
MHKYRKVLDGDAGIPLPAALTQPEDCPDSGDPRLSRVKSEATKRYLTENWERMFHQREERDARAIVFKERLRASSLSEKERKREAKRFSQSESQLTRFARIKPSVRDFRKIKIIGRGCSGVIWLVRDRMESTYYAMKVINKLSIIVNEQADSVKSERNVLSSLDNPWVVTLIASFQDPENLYLVLEFVQGGDLLALLSRASVLDENTARFYVAEIALAIQSVHELGFVHRDIKPDNILLTPRGHIKLADFGLSTQFEKRDTGFRQMLEELKAILIGEQPIPVFETQSGTSRRPKSIVGTVDYMAPEVLSQEGYDARCDWWSLGIIVYEMLFGVRPFASRTPTESALKIVRWRSHLNFPSVPKLSPQAIDFIQRLLTDAEERMTFEQVKQHPFFAGFDWNSLEKGDGPFIPNIRSPEDLSAFEPLDEESSDRWMASETSEIRQPQVLKYAFLGYTYKRPRKSIATARSLGLQ